MLCTLLYDSLSLGELMQGQDRGVFCTIEQPYLVILAAKKSSTAGNRELEAELLGQLRVLMAKS